MEKMTESGIPLRKAIAMGMHEEMYGEDGEPREANSSAKPTRKPRRIKAETISDMAGTKHGY